MIRTDIKKKEKKIFSPVFGKVKNIQGKHTEIEVEGIIIKGTEGFGRETSGELYIKKGRPSWDIRFWIRCDCEGGSHLRNKRGNIIKLEVLEAAGFLFVKSSVEINLSGLKISDSDFEKISSYNDKSVYLRPGKKEAVIFDEG